MPEPVQPTGSGILDPNNLLSYAFNTINGKPMSPEEIARRRAVANALAGTKRPFPRNIGEGIASLGEALGERRNDVQLSAAEADLARRVGADIQKAAAPAGFTGAPAAPVPGTGPRTDAEDLVNARRNSMTASLVAGGPGGAPVNPTQAAGASSPQEPAPAAGGPEPDDVWAARSNAIGGIESGGRKDPYRTVGVPTKYGPALGKYGVVAANVPKWTQAALGQSLTPEQYLADDKAQDAVFRHRFGSYVDQFGEEGAARAWFGGPGNVANVNATDAHGRLTIGTYGKDYLRRLQGANTATSGAAPGDDTGPPNLATDDSGNPPTPTSIKPMQVAQANTGRLPGAFDPRVPEPPGPPSGLRPVDPSAARPIGKPVAPVLDTRPTPEEAAGWELKQKYPTHKQAQEAADALMQRGAAKREAAYKREVEAYNKDYAAWEAERTRAYEQPAKDFELAEKRKEAQQKEQDRTDFPLGLDKHHTIVKESYDQVKNIPTAQTAIAGVKELLASDPGMFTGTGANIQLSLAKVAQKFGLPFDPKASNTETFRGMITPIIASLRPAIVGPGSQSQPEFKLLQDAAAGNVSLERRSIENILSAIERQGVLDAVAHQRTMIANAGGRENLRQIWSNSYALPMEKLVPRDMVEKLRSKVEANPDKAAAEIEKFNRAYYTPGLGEKLLGR